MRVVNRNGFWCLTHSWREEGKVLTKDHYLGKEIPKDIETHKEVFLRTCLKHSFLLVRQLKNAFRKEWKKYPASIKKEMLTSWAIELTYNTNAIEGSTITLEETENIIKRKLAPSKPLDEIQETVSHAKVFFSLFHDKRPLSESLLLDWHRGVFSETKPDIAGRLRDYSVRVGMYRAPDWQDVPQLMKKFLGWYRRQEKLPPPVELAARAHYKFEKIHPFGDGNGRIGRLLIAYILCNARYPLLIIQQKKRQRYYHALQKTEHDFVLYFVKEYLKIKL